MSYKILIADDSPTITDILGLILTEQGYEIEIATDGVEAIKAVYRMNPDLILLDVEMPKMNGYQVCRLLKNNLETHDIPIIILTSRDQRMDRFWGLTTGADDYVTKDFESQVLFDTIAGYLAKSTRASRDFKPREVSERSVLEQVNALLDKQLFHSTLVNALGALVVNSLSVEQTVKSVLDLLDKVCEFTVAGIVWHDLQRCMGVLRYPADLEPELVDALCRRLNDACAERNCQLDMGALLHFTHSPAGKNRQKGETLKRVWLQPLTARESVLGILAIGNTDENAFRPETEETLHIFCKETSIILDNAILFDRLEVSKKSLEKTLHELQETQAQLVHSEKMASLGQLVAGVAHELNNPISFIYGNMGYLEDYVAALKKLVAYYRQIPLTDPYHSQAQRLVEEIDVDYTLMDLDKVISSCRNGAERTKRIVLDLRNFSRLDRSEVGQLKVEEGIDGTLNLLTHKYKHRVAVHLDYGQTPPIECFVGQLNQVFMNLLSNAADAVGESGAVWVRTFTRDEWVIIEIKDNGCGISEDKLSKIFDPFFTTKPIGKGTGLGLSISYGIIEKHGGKISVSSRIGAGTTFTVELPTKVKQEDK